MADRCTAAEITAVLAAAAQHEDVILVDRLPSAVPGPCTITTARNWRVSFWFHPDFGVAWTMDATAPDGRTWQHGCQRFWEEDGGPVVEPLDGLTAQQRDDLTERVDMAAPRIRPDGDGEWVVADDRLRAKRPHRVGRR